MLSAIKFLIKTAAFATIVLVLGNLFQWKGKTVSDQVKTSLAHAEKSEIVTGVKDWTHNVQHEASHELKKKKQAVRTSAAQIAPAATATLEEISTTERQKLRALIRDLNFNASN